MSRSCPAQRQCCPADPGSRGAHACNGHHIPCKTHSGSRTLDMWVCRPTQRTPDAIYQQYELRSLKNNCLNSCYESCTTGSHGSALDWPRTVSRNPWFLMVRITGITTMVQH